MTIFFTATPNDPKGFLHLLRCGKQHSNDDPSFTHVAMQENKLRALKTICGAIHYTLTRYQQREIGQRDWEYLCSYLELDKTSLYGIELHGSGFVFWSKTMRFRYRGSQFHQQRKVEIHYLTT